MSTEKVVTLQRALRSMVVKMNDVVDVGL
jgi:hypothetical protein